MRFRAESRHIISKCVLVGGAHILGRRMANAWRGLRRQFVRLQYNLWEHAAAYRSDSCTSVRYLPGKPKPRRFVRGSARRQWR
eukprot:6199050-Pleurochrysis_carterae.AAC.1